MKRYHNLFLLLCLLMVSCGSPNHSSELNNAALRLSVVESTSRLRHSNSVWEESLRKAGLLDVQQLDSSIKVQLRYSSTNNFLKLDVYGDMEHAYLQPEVARMLVSAQQSLKELHPGYSLLVLDAARPLTLQRVFWDSIKVPHSERPKYVANPNNGGSLHNYGAAVDVTLMDSTGTEVDMGCAFDYFGELAYPVSEWKFLASGELTKVQVARRALLRQVMSKAGFFNIQTEWWHFNACTRDQARGKYQLLE